MYFLNLQNMAFLICHHYISSLGFRRGKNALSALWLFLGVDISLAAGLMSCSANENAKTLTKGLLTAPSAHSPQCL